MAWTILLAACIVALSAAVSAYLLANQLRRHQDHQRREDYTRAEARADRAAALTGVLIETNERIARRTNESAEAVEARLAIIHRLVNSGLTLAKQSEADAMEREVALMVEVIGLNESAGRPPSTEAQVTLAATRQRLIDLRAELVDRRAEDEATAVQSEQLGERLAYARAQ